MGISTGACHRAGPEHRAACPVRSATEALRAGQLDGGPQTPTRLGARVQQQPVIQPVSIVALAGANFISSPITAFAQRPRPAVQDFGR